MRRRCVACAALLAAAACGKTKSGEETAPSASASSAVAIPSTTSAPDAAPTTSASSVASTAAAKTPCPDDMAYVNTTFCPKVERECIDVEHEHPNNLTICHKYAPGKSTCKEAEEQRQFCIDRYEYPNQKGAHPVWMLTWTQAQATCESKGKRLCWSSEWTSACEGSEHTPFPYGWARDHDKCNIDSFFIDPRKPKGGNWLFYSKDPEVAFPELSRLDQSVPSGSQAECKSDFGVYDQTGNMDEWVISDRPPEDKSKWAGLKGGAWGHVRSQCRPMTTSHEPEFYYYFVSFRCCRDADGAPPWSPPADRGNVPAPVVEPHDFAPTPIVPVNPSGPSKTKYGEPQWK